MLLCKTQHKIRPQINLLVIRRKDLKILLLEMPLKQVQILQFKQTLTKHNLVQLQQARQMGRHRLLYRQTKQQALIKLKTQVLLITLARTHQMSQTIH